MWCVLWWWLFKEYKEIRKSLVRLYEHRMQDIEMFREFVTPLRLDLGILKDEVNKLKAINVNMENYKIDMNAMVGRAINRIIILEDEVNRLKTISINMKNYMKDKPKPYYTGQKRGPKPKSSQSQDTTSNKQG